MIYLVFFLVGKVPSKVEIFLEQILRNNKEDDSSNNNNSINSKGGRGSKAKPDISA